MYLYASSYSGKARENLIQIGQADLKPVSQPCLRQLWKYQYAFYNTLHVAGRSARGVSYKILRRDFFHSELHNVLRKVTNIENII